MTDKEKAKAYDEAIRKAKIILGCCNSASIITKHTIYDIFPELAESEDEQIRKEIISALKNANYKGVYNKHLAWLEKQNEQKDSFVDFKAKDWYVSKVDGKIHNIYHSVDKIEPKFKVGDWVVQENIGTYKVVEVCESWYEVIDSQNNHYSIGFDKEYMCHLWTIQDAKDGDVLINNTIVLIVDHFGTFENRPIIYSWYFADSNKFYGMGPSEPDRWEVEGFLPATKEQRDLLFQKMKAAGYEWDAEKKELKKIEENKGNLGGISPNWSEEDKDFMYDTLSNLTELKDRYGEGYGNVGGCIDWLKSLKGRVQPKQEWGEEDETGLGDALWAIKQARTIAKDENDMGNLWYAEKWLKSLRPQNTWKPSDDEIEKASQEWDSKAIFNPFYMTMDGDKPTGVKQDITTHKESFKAGVEWILKKIGF